MMSIKERLHQLVDEMPETEAEALLRIAEAKSNPPPTRVSAMGKFAHVGVSSEEFIRNKQEEIALEEEKANRHWSGKAP